MLGDLDEKMRGCWATWLERSGAFRTWRLNINSKRSLQSRAGTVVALASSLQLERWRQRPPTPFLLHPRQLRQSPAPFLVHPRQQGCRFWRNCSGNAGDLRDLRQCSQRPFDQVLAPDRALGDVFLHALDLLPRRLQASRACFRRGVADAISCAADRVQWLWMCAWTK